MLKRVNNRNRNNEREPGAANAREPGAANAREPGASNVQPGASNVQPGASTTLHPILVFLEVCGPQYPLLIENIKSMGIDFVEELSLATESELVNAGIPMFKARVLLSRAKSFLAAAASQMPPAPVYVPVSAAAAAAAAAPQKSPAYFQPPAPASASITTTPISQLASFRDIGRDNAIDLLAGQLNTYMFHKSRLFPTNDKVYIITVYFVNNQFSPDFAHLLIVQDKSQDNSYKYKYINEKLESETGDRAWYDIWFNSVHTMIKTRFPGIVGPAVLRPQKPASSISQWASFRDVSRAESLALLAGQFNTYMLRKSSLFPNDDNVYVVTVCFLNDQSRPDFSHLLIGQRLSQERGREYMYVTEMLVPEAGSPAWSNHWFDSVHTMIKARFPGIVGPAFLQPPAAAPVPAAPVPAGGRRKTKKSNRMSRHKSTKKSNRTMLRKQTRRTRH